MSRGEVGPQNRRPTWLCPSLPCLGGLAWGRALSGVGAAQGDRKERMGSRERREGHTAGNKVQEDGRNATVSVFGV